MFPFNLSADPSKEVEAVHAYDVYENVLLEVQGTPASSRSIFHDFLHGVDPATEVALKSTEEAFLCLERKVEEMLGTFLGRIRGNDSCRELQVERCDVDVLRRYFAFLRFRNGKAYQELVHSIRRPLDDQMSRCGIIYSAYHPFISQLHLRVILKTILAYLTSDDTMRAGSGTENQYTSTTLLRNFHDAMQSYCWSLRGAEVCFGIATDEQEFLLPNTCYGTLTENYTENP